MKKADCYHLGYIAKLHGFKGEVSLFLDVTNPSEYKGLDALYVDINGNLTPFFIQRFDLKPKGFVLTKLEGIDSENDAKAILRKNVFLPLEQLPELSGKQFYDHEVVDFTLIDVLYGEVGKIVQIIDLPVNPLIQVEANGKEVLIPFVKDLIQEVDRTNRILKVKAPEGLYDIYLA
jgi:16S rRNA processing protein RimM